jgi:ornithine--oxo-acid transaminase
MNMQGHPGADQGGGESSSKRAIALEERVTAPNYHPVDVVLERGSGEWLYDIEGRRYLDLMSAYSAVSHGHSHPRLVAALHAQAQRLAIASRAFRSAAMGPFLEKLTAITGLEMAMPANGGVESVESAVKCARRWGYQVKGIAPDQANIVVARGNFHGRTTTVVSFSSEDEYRRDFGPLTPGFRMFDFGDIDSLAAAVDGNTCAVLFEPIQGESGVRIPPEGFLRAARRLCDERRALLIFDEIQSGLGRTGRWFACDHEGVRPDGLILGKALGGGLLPVSAFVSTREVLGLMKPGSHGSTFGGNALASAVGLEALRVIEEEDLVGRSARLGEHLLARLRAIQAGVPAGTVIEVRGRGLWAGIELDPAHVSARAVVEEMARRGVLTKETHETVIRFAPPLVISQESLDWGLSVFAEVLGEQSR